MVRFIVHLSDKNLTNKLIGGKALNLAKLKKAGFNVPNAFVITTEAKGRMNQELENLIFEHLKNLQTKNFAVRSSATCEDKRFVSFAGQFESYLSIEREDLIEAIKKCWASIFKKRVLAYCSSKNIPMAAIKMAVLVQKMIFAEKGGVIFTEDIFRNNRDALIIESAKGLGEKIVSGLVNPERVIVSKKNKEIIEKDSPSGRVLTDKEIKELTDIALKIEEFYRFPQDIEWAIMKNKIYILQSRPITK